MSVRAKIEEFEERCKKRENSKDNKNESGPGKRKRFAYPGNSSNRAAEQQDSSLTSLPSGFGLGRTSNKPSAIAGFEADLQDIWSVKKNIHHTGKKPEGSSSSSSQQQQLPSGVQVTAGQYSRHGAIPAHQSQAGPQIVCAREALGKGRSRKEEFTSHRLAVQEHNSKEGPWNLRSSTFSYSELAATLKPEAAPHKNEDRSPPTAKRRTNLGAMDVIKPTTGDRVSYAKKMAEGYLRSEGLGKYTPKVDGNDKEKSASPERDDFTTAQPKTSPHHDHSSEQHTRSTMYPKAAATTRLDPAPQKLPSPPPKRKISAEAMDTHVANPSDGKLQYAKRMAKGYLRSEGLGKYTPGVEGKERSASPEFDHLAAFEASLKEPAHKESSTLTHLDASPASSKPAFPSSHKSEQPTAKRKTSAEAMDTHVEKASEDKRLYAKRMAERYLRQEGLGEYASVGRKEKSASPEPSDGSHAPKPTSEKLQYAKRMARGYLRSEGLGKYTPKGGGGGGSPEKKRSPEPEVDRRGLKWRKSEDEFDF